MGFRDFLMGKNYVKKSELNNNMFTQLQMQEYEEVVKGLNGKQKFNDDPAILTGSIPLNNKYKEVPSAKGLYQLRAILKRMSHNIVVQSIIRTRSNQIALYCTPARFSEDGIGFKLIMKDPTKNASNWDKQRMKEIEDFILHTGVGKSFDRDDFLDFVKKILSDLFTYDQINFELIYNRSHVLTGIKAVDASTMYIGAEKNRTYKQVIEDRVLATFKPEEMAWECMNPRTDIRVSGYGYSPIEVAISHLMYHSNTEEFNARFFAQGGTTRGLLLIKTAQMQGRQALANFRRSWTSMFSGVNGAWKIPVITADDAKFVNMNQSAHDMEFSNWLTYLINILASVFSIDPSEINFPNNGGVNNHGKATVNEGNTAETRLRSSKDKGLDPLLGFIEGIINKYIVENFSDRYRFVFTGGDSQAELNKINVAKARLSAGATWNEVRVNDLGLTAITEEITNPFDYVGDATFVQAVGQMISQKQFEQLQRANQVSGASTLAQQGKQVTNGNKQQRGQNNSNPAGTDGSVKNNPRNANNTNQGGKDSFKERNKS